jgi:hypothetical protein
MKKTVLFLCVLLFLTGCANDNKITITNLAAEYIYFNFRAVKYDIASNTSLEIKDIPNGTYTYSTTYWIPNTAKTFSITEAAAAGELTFEKKDTRVLLLYASTFFEGAYNVNVTKSTTNSSTSITGQ